MSTGVAHTAEYSNDEIKVSAKHLPGCMVELEITALPELSQQVYKEAVKEVRKEVSIPGFRRGKAPEATIINKFSSQIESEWKRILFNTSLSKAVEVTQLYPAQDGDRPRIKEAKAEHYSSTAESRFKIIYETTPTTPSIDIEQLTLSPAEKQDVTDEECAERLYEIRLYKADWQDVEGRAIEDGDFVDLSAEPKTEDEIDEEEAPAEEDETIRLCVDRNKIAETLYENLIGRQVNETFIDTTIDGEKAPTLLTIKKIVAPILPELDEAFAKQLGTKDCEELKSQIRKHLQGELDHKNHQKESEEIITQLLQNHPMDVPESQKNKQLEIVRNQLRGSLEKSSPKDTSAKAIDLALKQLTSTIDERTKEIIHLRYLVHAIAEKKGLAITNDEFKEEMMRLIYLVQSGQHPTLSPSEDLMGMQEEVYHQLLTQKVLNYLISNIREKS